MPKFTDKQLADLYARLNRACTKLFDEEKKEFHEVFSILYQEISTQLNQPVSDNAPLAGLDEADRLKVYNVLYTVLDTAYVEQQKKLVEATYPVPKTFHEYTKAVNTPNCVAPIVIVRNNYDPCCYHDYHDNLLTWALLTNMSYHNHCYVHTHAGAGAGGGGGCFPSIGGGSGSGNGNNDALAYLLLILIAAILVVMALVALYFMLNQIAESVERFVYSEGWLQATMTLAGVAAGGTAGAFLGLYILTPGIIALALAAGVSNPIGWAILGIVCSTIIGAAAVGGLTNFIQNKAIESLSKDALDHKDRYRFELTDSQMEHLTEKGLDPVAVKCAITELRLQMQRYLGEKEEKIPSFISRLFPTENEKKVNEYHRQIRALRSGNVGYDYEVKIPRDDSGYFFQTKLFNLRLKQFSPMVEHIAIATDVPVMGQPVPMQPLTYDYAKVPEKGNTYQHMSHNSGYDDVAGKKPPVLN